MKINGARRAVMVGGSVAACLVTGSDKLANGCGNGDCLMLDLKNLFFAVADGSERFPTASRDFLRRLSEEMAARPEPATREDWLAMVNAAYARQKNPYNTTFCGVALRVDGREHRATVVSGGDSQVFVVDLATRSLVYASGVDMNFAGRTIRLSKVENVPLDSGDCRIVIASDGLVDVARATGLSVGKMAAAALERFPIHEVPGRLARFLSRQAGMIHDDITVVALDPTQLLSRGTTRLLMGGTHAADERHYQKILSEKGLPDAWVSPEESRAFTRAVGIRILD